MPVNDTHPQYEDFEDKWERSRTVLDGSDAVKKAGVLYLPQLEGQNNEEYLAYKTRAEFFNATARTLDGLIGMVFRKPPKNVSPEGPQMEAFRSDVDLRGTTQDDYAKDIVREVLSVGRAGTWVDWEDQVENRVFFIKYKAEDIINWQVKRINGRMMLTLVVLKECVDTSSPLLGVDTKEQPVSPKESPDQNDEGFETEEIEQLRVLKLVIVGTEPGSKTSRLEYQVDIWQKSADNRDTYSKVESYVPTRQSVSLSAIPFVFHGPKNSFPAVDKLPLEDLICLNLDHYRLNADYKHGLHFTGLPTAWVSGFPKDQNLRIGSATAWVTETVGASAGYLEFTGQGLGALETALGKDERLMAVLGARLLEDQKKDAETAETLKIRQAGENSILSSVVGSVNQSLTMALKWALWWNSTEENPEAITDDKISVGLNMDFMSLRLSPDELNALVKSWQSGAISHQTLLHNLRQGEIIPPTITDEEEMALIEQNLPPLLAMPQTPPANG